jgi:hypothetical protein
VRFTVEQRFAADADAVAAAYADPSLYDALPATEKLDRPEVVRHDGDGSSVVLEVRYRFHGDLSSAVRAVLDPSRLTWVERTAHDLAGRTASFELRPDHYPDRLRARGTVRVEPTGDGGSRRVVEGDLKVRAPLVAGTVERTLVGDLRRHLEAEAPAVDAYLGAAGA